MSIDNTTGKKEEFYELGARMFERLKPLKPIKPYIDTLEADIELMWQAHSADTEALMDARDVLKIIKDTDPDVYDEMIDECLALIDKALGMNNFEVMERVMDRARGQK